MGKLTGEDASLDRQDLIESSSVPFLRRVLGPQKRFDDLEG
jgi:hypothetical protein